jgi:hypothetical protein
MTRPNRVQSGFKQSARLSRQTVTSGCHLRHAVSEYVNIGKKNITPKLRTAKSIQMRNGDIRNWTSPMRPIEQQAPEQLPPGSPLPEPPRRRRRIIETDDDDQPQLVTLKKYPSTQHRRCHLQLQHHRHNRSIRLL